MRYRWVFRAISVLSAFLSGSGTWADECQLATTKKTEVRGVEILTNDKNQRSNLSGLACAPPKNGSQVCLLVQDERYEFLTGTLESRQLTFTTQSDLPKLSDKGEYDAEAVTFVSGDSFLVMGSQGRRAKKCLKDNPSSRQITRITIPTADQPPEIAALKSIVPAMLQSLPALAELAPFYDACLGTVLPKDHDDKKDGVWTPAQGINFEGIANIGDYVYLGLRGPVIAKEAGIIKVKLADIQTGTVPAVDDPTVRIIPVALNGQGIRDMINFDGRLLILSGPEDDGTGHPALTILNPESGVLKPVCEIPVGQLQDSPEAILRLPMQDNEQRLLVLTDGVKDGDPREYVITVPAD